MVGTAPKKEASNTHAAPEMHANWRHAERIERELHAVEELILISGAADAFVEDLVSLHRRRNALLAALSIHRAKERGSLVDLAAWRKRAPPVAP